MYSRRTHRFFLCHVFSIRSGSVSRAIGPLQAILEQGFYYPGQVAWRFDSFGITRAFPQSVLLQQNEMNLWGEIPVAVSLMDTDGPQLWFVHFSGFRSIGGSPRASVPLRLTLKREGDSFSVYPGICARFLFG